MPKGQGCAKIQELLKHQKPHVTIKEILYKLCTEFTIIHQVDLTRRGVGSEIKSKSNITEGGLSGKRGSAARTVWQRKADAHVMLIEGKRGKTSAISRDQELDQIRRDRNLNHTVHTIPSQADSARKRNNMLRRCVVCAAGMSSSVVRRTVYQCEPYGVFLCIKIHGRKKKR